MTLPNSATSVQTLSQQFVEIVLSHQGTVTTHVSVGTDTTGRWSKTLIVDIRVEKSWEVIWNGLNNFTVKERGSPRPPETTVNRQIPLTLYQGKHQQAEWHRRLQKFSVCFSQNQKGRTHPKSISKNDHNYDNFENGHTRAEV